MAERVFLAQDLDHKPCVGEEVAILLRNENNKGAGNYRESRLESSRRSRSDVALTDDPVNMQGEPLGIKTESNTQTSVIGNQPAVQQQKRPGDEGQYECSFCHQVCADANDLLEHQEKHIKTETQEGHNVIDTTERDETPLGQLNHNNTSNETNQEINKSNQATTLSDTNEVSYLTAKLIGAPQRAVEHDDGETSEVGHGACADNDRVGNIAGLNHISHSDKRFEVSQQTIEHTDKEGDDAGNVKGSNHASLDAEEGVSTSGESATFLETSSNTKQAEQNDKEDGNVDKASGVISNASCMDEDDVVKASGVISHASCTDEYDVVKRRAADLCDYATDGGSASCVSIVKTANEDEIMSDGPRPSSVGDHATSPASKVSCELSPDEDKVASSPDRSSCAGKDNGIGEISRLNLTPDRQRTIKQEVDSPIKFVIHPNAAQFSTLNESTQAQSNELSDLGAIRFCNEDREGEASSFKKPFPVAISTNVVPTDVDATTVVTDTKPSFTARDGLNFLDGMQTDATRAIAQCNSLQLYKVISDTNDTTSHSSDQAAPDDMRLHSADESNKPNASDEKYKYPCFYCGRRFQRAGARSDHERSHNENLQFKCSTCGKRFNRKRSLRYHEITHDLNLAKFECRKCKLNFHTQEEKDRHLQEHKKIGCKFCDYTSKRPYDLMKHEKTHKERKKLKCPYCDVLLSSNEYLNKHKHKFHGVKPEKYWCVRCQVYFKTKEEKKAHVQQHIDERNHACSYCGKTYKFVSHKQEHERTHDKSIQLQCSYCPKTFARRKHLVLHEDWHETEKQRGRSDGLDQSSYRSSFQCWRCKVVFQSKAEKQQHCKKHVTKAAHNCRFCGRLFKYSSHRSEHEKKHAVDDKWNCLFCKSKFASRRHLIAHNNQVTTSQLCNMNGLSRVKKKKQVRKTSKTDKCKDRRCQEDQTVLKNGKYSCGVCRKVVAGEFQLKTHKVVHQHLLQSSPEESELEKDESCKVEIGGNGQDVMEEGSGGSCARSEESDGTRVINLKRRDEGSSAENRTSMELSSQMGDDDEVHTPANADMDVVTVTLVSICEFCDRTFRSEKGMLNHQKKKHKNTKEPYMCPDCPKTFATRTERDTHLQEHLSMRPFQCRFCPKRFKKAHHCREHELLHDVSSQLKCAYCEKGFTNKRYLQKHQLGKRSKKPLMCGSCSKCFSLKTCLMYHEKVCGKEDPASTTATTASCSSTQSIPPDGAEVEEISQPHSKKVCVEETTKESYMSDEARATDVFPMGRRDETSTTDVFPMGRRGGNRCRKPTNQPGDEAKFVKYLEGMIDVHLRNELAIDGEVDDEGAKATDQCAERVKDKVFKCKFCAVIFDTNIVLVRHEYLHTKKQARVCWFCNLLFKTEELKTEHELTHRVDSHLCQECGMFFKTLRRMETHDCKNPKAKMEYNCERCEEKFSDPQHLLQHEKGHTGRRTYECSSCKSGFVSMDSFEFHLGNEHGIMSASGGKSNRKGFYSCRFCRKGFHSETYLQMHEKGHTGTNLYSCYYCKAAFQTRSSLLKHEEDTHGAERPYQCNVCGQRFRGEFKLQEHTMRHRESEFRCECCTRSFSYDKELLKHEKSHPDLKKYSCSSCDEKFACDLNRMMHARRQHNATYQCPLCGQNLATSSALARHLIDHKKKNQTLSGCHRFADSRETLRPKSPKNLMSHPADSNSIRGPLDGNKDGPSGGEKRVSELNHVEPTGIDNAEVVSLSNGCAGDGLESKETESPSNSSDYRRKLRTRHPSCNSATKQGGAQACTNHVTNGKEGDSDSDEIQEIFQCKFCGKNFEYQNNCVQHEILHSPEKQWQCGSCRTSYFTKKLLVEHMENEQHKTHIPIHMNGDGNVKESMKAVRVIAFENGIDAIQNKDGDSGVVTDKKRESVILNDESKLSDSVADVKSTNAIPKPWYECIYCFRKFRSHITYKNHKKTHTDSKSYHCRYCVATFDRKKQRDNHEKEHYEERPHKCGHCTWHFKKKWHRNDHEKIHIEPPQMNCEACTYSFRRPVDLWRHDKTHGKDGQHECTKCSSRFYNFRVLQYHWKLFHTSMIPPWKNNVHVSQKTQVRNKKVLTCTRPRKKTAVCTKKFTTKRKKIRRQAKVDASKRMRRLSQCGEKLERKDGKEYAKRINKLSKRPQSDEDGKQLNSVELGESVLVHDTQHQCQLCHKRFESLNHVWKHEKVHTGVKLHKCDKCISAFFNKGSLIYHLQTNHKASEVLTQAENAAATNGRIIVHYPDTQHKCELCGKRFKRLRSCYGHERWHTGARGHKCPKCPARFFNKGSVNYHLQLEHGATLERMDELPQPENKQASTFPKFKCNKCLKLFSSQNHLAEHERLHDPNLQFHCEVCDKSFTRAIRLWRHEVVHNINSAKKKYQCNQCQTGFFSKGSHDYHVNRHHSAGLSGKRSNKKKKKYTVLQQKQKIYPCSHCSKTFGNAEVAKRHEASHSHRVRHGCTFDGCEERFTSQVLMEQHFLKEHKSDRPYQCSFCPKTFKTVGHFTYHETGHQPEKLPYVCEVCQKGFVRPRAVFRHEQSHKGMKKYKCEDCSVQCHNMISIMYHKLSKHGITYRQQGLHKYRDTCKSKYNLKSAENTHFAQKNQAKRTIARQKPQSDVVQQKAQRIEFSKTNSTEDSNESEAQFALVECKDENDEVPMSDDQSPDVMEVTKDTSFTCELCTEEFNSERELRRHKRLHSVEIKAMQSLFKHDDGATQEQYYASILHSASILKPMKRKGPATVIGEASNKEVKRGRGRPKGTFKTSTIHRGSIHQGRGRPKGTFKPAHLKKSTVKTKNARSKLIQRRTRRAAFRQGIRRLKTSQKVKGQAVEENKVAKMLKHLSWDTGVEEGSPVVESRFRIRSPAKKDDHGTKAEETGEVQEDVVILDDDGAGGDDSDVVEVPVVKSPRCKKAITNGHIFRGSPKGRKDCKVERTDTRARSPRRLQPSKFLSLLKETEKEREDGMAFVSRNIPVLYNGHCRSCIQCGRRFETDEALAEHQKWHTCSKRIRCLECNMWCENDKTYRAHWKEHALHRLLYCKHCGKDFPDKELLWRHEKTHNREGNSNGGGGKNNASKKKMEEKTHICDMCSEAFVTADELKVHQVSHTAPRAFVCEHCSMSFNQERQLRSHQTRHVGDLMTWQKSFGCPLCGGMFRSSDELKSHERTFHGFDGKFECHFCDRIFGVEKNWRAHEQVHRIKKDKRKRRSPQKDPDVIIL